MSLNPFTLAMHPTPPLPRTPRVRPATSGGLRWTARWVAGSVVVMCGVASTQAAMLSLVKVPDLREVTPAPGDEAQREAELLADAEASSAPVVAEPGTFGVPGETYSPGNSPGLGVFGGDIRLGSTSTLLIELGGVIRGTQYDAVDIGGDFDLRGRLTVELIDGFVPQLGDVFHIVRVGGQRQGTFRDLPEGSTVGIYGGLPLQITYTAGDGNDIALTAVPQPATLALTLLGAALALARRNRAHG